MEGASQNKTAAFQRFWLHRAEYEPPTLTLYAPTIANFGANPLVAPAEATPSPPFVTCFGLYSTGRGLLRTTPSI